MIEGVFCANRNEAYEAIAKLGKWPEDGLVMTIETPERMITTRQKNALHVWCRMMAAVYSDAGIDQLSVFRSMKEGVEIPWTQASIKELWRSFQRELTGIYSTTQLNTKDPTVILDVITRFNAERWPKLITPAWPSIEAQSKETKNYEEARSE